MATVHLLVRPALRPLGSVLLPNWLAITVGHTVVSWRRLAPQELAHELRHVRQWEAHGSLGYPLRYLSASVRAALSGKDWYRDNPFEIEARRAADQARARWTE